jgi:hypothetical protein
MSQTRRAFVAGAGIGLLGFTVAGAPLMLTPRQARARGADFRVLTAGDVVTLEAAGEILVPGAAEAGLAYFVDQQLAADPNENLLMARYFNIEPPYVNFYRGALAGIDGLSRRRHQQAFALLPEASAVELIRDVSTGNPDGWEGPPAMLAYLLLRSDAVDVVYGTVEGFARMKIPYMPHILPPEPW